MRISEAAPDPAPGPDRDALVALNEAQARTAQADMEAVLRSYLDRSLSVVLARLRGPKARKSTRWWTAESKDAAQLETKALDPEYVVPAKLAGELAGDLEPVAIRIATTAAEDAARSLGDTDPVPSGTVEKFVRLSLDRLRALGERHAREVRAAVLDADVNAADLDELIQRVEAAHRRGGAWLLMSGRTLANALRNEAALERGRVLGVTHTQWLSKRDERVRATHVVADGQIRAIGTAFKVGRAKLRFPGDPSGLPQTWEEVAGCRCGLLMRRPSEAARAMLAIAAAGREDENAPAAALTGLHGTVARAIEAGTEVYAPTPEGYDLPETTVYTTIDRPVVAYRVLDRTLDVSAGQRLTLPGLVVLGLAPPVGDAVVLTVVIPAGAVVGLAGGALVLGRGTRLEVLGSGDTGVTAQLATG